MNCTALRNIVLRRLARRCSAKIHVRLGRASLRKEAELTPVSHSLSQVGRSYTATFFCTVPESRAQDVSFNIPPTEGRKGTLYHYTRVSTKHDSSLFPFCRNSLSEGKTHDSPQCTSSSEGRTRGSSDHKTAATRLHAHDTHRTWSKKIQFSLTVG